ncbi:MULTISPECIES: NUDIX domain-containing protein [unclassified Sphingomonas]|uniref:NUDIX domain-containing protein n=1 Tax=unclassified Sphingomonas TaxID=196159 RepID=UPI0017CF90F5|nr:MULTISPECIES: NUDIX domain-containing protein [unclassified Sphingomonas]MBB3346817.1 8-oxo-dGTP pyrophosphatase MutT (NUDIX family) [Sphingomonas sp. BK069]MBB3472803.1 8-oxo-dGTP pyrophosphatase MutT (NUDIX family) [Sphingomonas sp. BK345]
MTDHNDDAMLPPAIPAATLIVFRDRAGLPPELLLVERSPRLAFAPGATVFPGGRVDPGDVALAGALGPTAPADAAARIAAIRETIEETGVAIGVAEPAAVDSIRAALRDGAALREALDGSALDLGQLVPFARWRPRENHARVFDALFYLARLPTDALPARVDSTENVRLDWASARETLDAAARGDRTLIFPTRRNLERLAQFASYDEAMAHARATPVRRITPWIEPRDGVDYLCIPDDLGYPITAEPVAVARRG